MAAVLAVATSGAGEAAAQSLSPMQFIGHDPNQPVHVDAYVGIDYALVSRQGETFGLRGLSREPYVLKTADFQISNLSRFDFGLNAAATSLLAIGGFTQPTDTSANVDTTQAERYAALIGYAIGKDVKIRAEAHYARLVTYASPNFETSSSYPVTTYYAPSSGGLTRLLPGGGVGGATTWTAAAFYLETHGNVLGFLGLGDEQLASIGYRVFELDTLSAYQVNDSNNTPTVQAVVQDSTTCHSLSLEARGSRELFSDVHLATSFHGFAGYALVSSSFVNAASGGCFGVGGTLSLRYDQPRWSLDVGVVLDQLVTVAFGGGNTLSENVAYNNPSTGRVLNAPAGSTWNVNGPGAESINAIGPYLHLTAHF